MKHFIVYLFFSLSLLGATLSKQEYTSIYKEAKELFAAKEFTKAYDKFYQLFEQNMLDPNINFDLGRTSFMLKEFDLAISAYERVLNIDPNSVRTRLEIAKCYYEMKDYKTAQAIFLENLKENVPQNVKQNINLYLKTINDKTTKNFFSGAAIVGINYDTNIYNRANDEIYAYDTGATGSNTTPDTSGYAHQEVLSLNHLYSYQDNVKFKNDLLFFNKSYFNSQESSRDIEFLQYSPGVLVEHTPRLIVDYSLIANKIWLGSNPLMKNFGIYPKMKYIYSPTTILGANYKRQKKLSTPYDTITDALEFTLRNIYSSEFSFYLYTQLAKERIVRGTQTNVDYNMYNVSFTTAYKYNKDLTISPKIQWYNKNFKDIFSPIIKEEEEDANEYQFLINSTYTYTNEIVLSLDYMYTDHRSNIQPKAFKKQAVTTNVILLF